MLAAASFFIAQREGASSWRVGVNTAQGRKSVSAKRIGERKDKTGGRKEWTLQQLKEAQLPPADPSQNFEVWEAHICRVHARWDKEKNSSRKMKSAVQYGARWHGTVPIRDLSLHGFSNLGVIEDIQPCDAAALYDCIMACAERGQTHGNSVDSPTTSVYLREPSDRVESWMSDDATFTVRGEKQLGALRRIKDALKAAVGKEGIEEVITEGLVARLSRRGGKPSMTAFPRRHSDFAQRYNDPEEDGEEAMAEAAENSYTPPVLAVMLILSKGGGVQTLFPSLDRKFTQSMGMQPIDPSEGGYYECRYQRWALAYGGGTGDQVPMTSASGASSGRTNTGLTCAHPRRAGGPSEGGGRREEGGERNEGIGRRREEEGGREEHR